MSRYCLIADQIVQVADDRLGRLLFDFMIPDGAAVDESRVLCRVGMADVTYVHGVRSIQTAHPVVHTFVNDLDPFGLLMADESYENLSAYNRREEKLVDTLLVGVYSRLIFEKTVFAHAALVDVPGYGGILFVGDSGVGKTTQAKLWAQHGGATILNGDKVLLGLREDAPGQVVAYGGPWKGSSPYCVNTRVSLRAIVSLIRRETDGIRLLSEAEAMTTYIPRIYMPGWDDRLTEMAMDTLNDMLPLVPVYEMSCHPDASAVEMVESAVLGRD